MISYYMVLDIYILCTEELRDLLNNVCQHIER